MEARGHHHGDASTPVQVSVCGDEAALEALRREYAAAGRDEGEDRVQVRHVDAADQLADVLDLVADGRSLIVVVSDPGLAADLFDQCRRLTRTEWFDPQRRPITDALQEVHLRVVLAVGEGDDIAAAARRCHLSTRTAARRLSEARRMLGARSTAEAVSILGRRTDELRRV